MASKSNRDPANVGRVPNASAPVREIGGDTDREPQPGIALCLSGGGYRAMLFHLGTLVRLNELGYLPRLARVSSVSGGSITAGVLAQRWSTLQFGSDGTAADFSTLVVDPIRSLAGHTIDVRSVLRGLITPRSTIADQAAAAYRRHLYGNATLQDLPDTPRFVFNATSLQSGVLMRFSKPYAWDYRVGEIKQPSFPLAVAVAASAAFPPVLGPMRIGVRPSDFVAGSGDDLELSAYQSQLVLSDGGVYDNLGVETAWKRCQTILVSDAGGHMSPDPRPHGDWIREMTRVLHVVDNQVRDLRKRQIIEGYIRGDRTGTYWGIRSDIANYPAPKRLPCPFEETFELAQVPTRLKRLEPLPQERLINWGYAACDAALRSHLDRNLPPPGRFPYPAAAVGATTGVPSTPASPTD